MVEAMKDNFQQIYSIELSEKLYELADFNDEDIEYLENFLGKWYESDKP